MLAVDVGALLSQDVWTCCCRNSVARWNQQRKNDIPREFEKSVKGRLKVVLGRAPQLRAQLPLSASSKKRVLLTLLCCCCLRDDC